MLLANRYRFRFASLKVDLAKGGEGRAYSVQFVFEARTFLFELRDYSVC